MRIAVIADTHVPDCGGSAQEAAMRWAVAASRAEHADVLAWAGDLTAVGDASAGDRVLAAVSASPVPCVLTPGNSDLRTPHVAADLRARFSVPAMADGGGVRHRGCREPVASRSSRVGGSGLRG